MSRHAPPRRSRSTDPVDRDELEALIEALIEEARQPCTSPTAADRRGMLLVALVAGGRLLRLRSHGRRRCRHPGRRGEPIRRRRLRRARRRALGPFPWALRGPCIRGRRRAECPGRRLPGHREGCLQEPERRAELAKRRACRPRRALRPLSLRITSLAVDPRSAATVYATRSVGPMADEFARSCSRAQTAGVAGALSASQLGRSPSVPPEPTTVYATQVGGRQS